MDDALNLARAGRLDYDIALSLSRQLAGEGELVPLSAAKTAIRFLDRMLRQADGYGHLQSYLLKLLEKVYKEVRKNRIGVFERTSFILCKYIQKRKFIYDRNTYTLISTKQQIVFYIYITQYAVLSGYKYRYNSSIDD